MWSKFLLEELFDVRKGKRLTVADQTDGDTPYIGSIEGNNGVSSYIGQKPIHQGNTISLSYDGSIGEAYYQPIPFWATDAVNVLYPRFDGFNQYKALYICTVLRQEKYRYSYGRKWEMWKMKKTILTLPSEQTQQGIIKPDWQYMEDYIKRLYPHIPETKNITRNLQCNNENITIDKNESNSWKTFFVKDVFPILESTKGTTVADMEDGDEIPYIAAKKESNGVDKLVARKGNEKYISKGNCIVFIQIGEGSAGYTTYQPGDFIGMRGKTLCGYNPLMNEYSGLFLETILDKERPKYSFGRSWTGDRLLNTKIQLPSTPEGTPDWQYMENYIKSLPYGDCLREYSEQKN